jgi:hypothetical protein
MDDPPPPMHLANGAFRFALELTALATMGVWGFAQLQSGLRYALMIAVPLSAAGLWGVFAVPGDPSRSGRAIVAVSGFVRLAVEGAVFGFATWALLDLGHGALSGGYAAMLGLHYAISHRRMRWLLRQ